MATLGGSLQSRTSAPLTGSAARKRPRPLTPPGQSQLEGGHQGYIRLFRALRGLSKVGFHVSPCFVFICYGVTGDWAGLS